MQEITTSYNLTCIDIVNNCMHMSDITDFIKASGRKDIVVLNANDFIDSKILNTKGDSKKLSKQITQSISKNLKAKIDNDLSKIFDTKKKAAALLEKQKAAAASGKRSRLKSSQQEEVIRFGGKIDIIYFLFGFPYLPSQLKGLLSNGINVTFFTTICPEQRPPISLDYQYERPKASGRDKSKKPSIPGSQFDYSIQPNLYPPARWTILKPIADTKIPFFEFTFHDVPTFFLDIESAVIHLYNSLPEFEGFISNRTLVSIPLAKSDIDTSIISDYLKTHPDDSLSLCNGLYSQLSKNGFHTVPPLPSKTESEILDEIFLSHMEHPPSNQEIPSFQFNHPNVNHILSPLKTFKISEENALLVSASKEFMSQNNFAYAGKFFDQLVQTVNKKRGLNLPASLFDFSNWNYVSLHENIESYLSDTLSINCITESLFDGATGTLFILALQPIGRQQGHQVTDQIMPPTIMNINDWIDRSDSEEKRFIDKSRPHYRMSLFVSDYQEIYRPYFLPGGLFVRVSREPFSFNGESQITFSGNEKNVSFAIHDFRVTIENNEINIFFERVSLRYKNGELTVKEEFSLPKIITSDGTFVTNDRIVKSDGIVSTRDSKNQWIDVDLSGTSYKDGYVICKSKGMLSNLTDGSHKVIRTDGVELIIDEYNIKHFSYGTIHVSQSSEKIKYSIPELSEIVYSNSQFSFQIGNIKVMLGSVTSHIEWDSNSAKIENDTINIDLANETIVMKPGEFQAKENKTIIYLNSESDVMGEVIDPSKKRRAEFVETKWGHVMIAPSKLSESEQVKLHHSFIPHFFAVNCDLSGRVYSMREMLKIEGFAERKSESDQVSIVTFHSENEVAGFLLENPLTKVQRSTALKELHVKKPKKGDDMTSILHQTIEKVHLINLENMTFINKIDKMIDSLHRDYIDEITPVDEGPPPPLFQPPIKVVPRIQKMAYFSDQNDHNFWKSREADFSVPDDQPKQLERPISPRVALFDPPRFSSSEIQEPLFEIVEQTHFMTQDAAKTIPTPAARDVKPLTLKVEEMKIVTCKLGVTKKCAFKIRNPGTRPIHFTVIPPDSGIISIETGCGIVTPGLSKEIKFSVKGKEVGEYNEVIRINTDDGMMSINFHAIFN